MRRLPSAIRDYAVTMLNFAVFGYEWRVEMLFALENTIIQSSGNAFVRGFDAVRPMWDSLVIEQALEFCWSSSRVLGAPTNALGGLTYSACATTVQAVNNTLNLVWCATNLFEETDFSSSQTTDMFESVYNPMFENLQTGLEQLASTVAITPTLQENTQCFGFGGGSSYAVLTPFPERWWLQFNCMETYTCDSICYEVMNEWSLFTLPPLEPGASAIKCDGLNAQCHPDTTCNGCNEGCQYACDTARSCKLTRCFGTEINMDIPMCNLGATVGSLGSSFVGMIEGAFKTIIRDISAAARKEPLTGVLPQKSIRSLTCGFHKASVELSTFLSSFLMTIFRASTADNPVRANTVIFGVVDFSASIFQIPSIFVSATVESIMQQVDICLLYTSPSPRD